MLRKIFFIAVLYVSLSAMFGTSALAQWTYSNIWGGAWNPYYVDHELKGGGPEFAEATVDTVWYVLKGDLILWNPKGKLVLGGIGFSVPARVSSTTEGLEPDENGIFTLRQLFPRIPADCDFEWPPGSGTFVDLCPTSNPDATTQERRFFYFWFPGQVFEDYIKNNSEIFELRIELAEVRVNFYGDFAKETQVDTRFKACFDLRDETWPDDFEFIKRDEFEPFACDDAYATTVDKTLKVTAPGPLNNDYDHEGHVLAVAEVDNIPVYPGFETITASGGTLTLYENGKFIYKPALGFDGDDYFTYLNADSNGNLSNEAIVTITVVPR